MCVYLILARNNFGGGAPQENSLVPAHSSFGLQGWAVFLVTYPMEVNCCSLSLTPRRIQQQLCVSSSPAPRSTSFIQVKVDTRNCLSLI